jgi:predicted aconitase
MILTKVEEDMLAGRQGPAKKLALEGLVQLGRAYGAPRMVEIGYAHIHAGMALTVWAAPAPLLARLIGPDTGRPGTLT